MVSKKTYYIPTHPHRTQTALYFSLCCFLSHVWTFPNMAFRSISEQDHCCHIIVSTRQSDFPQKNELLGGRRRNDFTQIVHVFFFLSENLPNRSFPFLLWNLRNHLSWCDDWSGENGFWVWTGKLEVLRGDFSNVVNVYLTCIHKLHL